MTFDGDTNTDINTSPLVKIPYKNIDYEILTSLFKIVTTMFECSTCKNVESAIDPICKTDSNKSCCAKSIVQNNTDLPIDIISIISEYATDTPSVEFLLSPVIPTKVLLECYVIKTSTQYEMFLEIADSLYFKELRACYLNYLANNVIIALVNHRKNYAYPEEYQSNIIDIIMSKQLPSHVKNSVLTAFIQNRLLSLDMCEELSSLLHVTKDSNILGTAPKLTEIFESVRNTSSKHAYNCAINILLRNSDIKLATSTKNSTLFKIKEYFTIQSANLDVIQFLKPSYNSREYYQYINIPIKTDNKYLTELSIKYNYCDEETNTGPRKILIKRSNSKIPNKNVDEISNYTTYQSIQPVWKEDIQAHSLQFYNNRVDGKSVKNCKVVRQNNSDKKNKNKIIATKETNDMTVFQCGRVKNNRSKFVVDFRSGISPINAFSILLSQVHCTM
jgi:hypothetical protein